MPTYEITAPDGRTFTLTGDSPPTEKELEGIFSSMKERPVTGGDAVRAGLSGATLGFGDELRAGAGALFDKVGGLLGDIDPSRAKGYTAYRDAERRDLDSFREAHPATAFGLEFGGGLLTGGLGGARAGGTAIGRQLLASPLKTRLAASSAVGAGTGALAGAGAAPEMADIPLDAAMSAVPGALMGPIAELGMSGVQSIGGAVKRAMTDPKHRATAALRQTLNDAEMSPLQSVEKQARMGPKAILADTSEAARDKLDTLAQMPGKTRQRAVEQLKARSRDQDEDLMVGFGPGQRIQKLDELQKFRETQSSPKYEEAYAKGIVNTPSLKSIFESIKKTNPAIWRDAKAQGARRLISEGKEDLIDQLGDAEPSLRGWHAIKMELDSLEGTAKRGGDKSNAASYKGLRQRLLREIDRQSPEYKEARKLWAGTMEFEEAIEEGRKMLRPGESSSVMADKLKKMTPTQKEAVRVGFVQALQDKIENQGYTHDVTKIFRNKAMERKLKALFDDPDEYKAFMNRMEASAEQQATYSRLYGSGTARRLQGGEDVMSLDKRQLIQDITEGRSTGSILGNQAAQWLQKGATKAGDFFRRDREMRDELGRMLLETDPQKQIQLLQQIMSRPQLPKAKGAGLLAPSALGAVGGIGAGLLVAP